MNHYLLMGTIFIRNDANYSLSADNWLTTNCSELEPGRGPGGLRVLAPRHRGDGLLRDPVHGQHRHHALDSRRQVHQETNRQTER